MTRAFKCLNYLRIIWVDTMRCFCNIILGYLDKCKNPRIYVKQNNFVGFFNRGPNGLQIILGLLIYMETDKMKFFF
jgi:hypothetical protein